MITEKERERTRCICENYQRLILRCAETITRLEFHHRTRHDKLFPELTLKYPARVELLKKALERLKKRHDYLTKQTLYEN